LLREALFQALEGYNPVGGVDGDVELRSLTAPVFGADGRIAFTLTLWGRPGLMSAAVVREHVTALRATAAAATRAIGGSEQ
jgi:DNA-binding IclR family transcriptional regulator